MGIPFEVRPADVEELTEGDPGAVVAENAMRKAMAVPGELVLGADTIVAFDGEVFGKPRDVGGVGVAERGEMTIVFHELTRVRFRDADAATLDWYVGTEEWEGRAGGYAIQGAGAALVEGIEGDYLNVVGLPLARLLDLRPDLLGTA